MSVYGRQGELAGCPPTDRSRCSVDAHSSNPGSRKTDVINPPLYPSPSPSPANQRSAFTTKFSTNWPLPIVK